MCLAVYIASDHGLPEIDWDESDPKFLITPEAQPVIHRILDNGVLKNHAG